VKRIILTGKNSQFPTFLPPRDPFPPRGQLARSMPSLVERASSYAYDATADRWVRPPTTIMVDAGAAADLRHTQTKHNPAAGLRRARRSPLARHLILELLEFFVVAIGLGASVILAVLLWAVMA
jgi:hypothetical protein